MAVIVACFIPAAASETPHESFFPLQVHWATDLGQPSVAPPAFDDHRAYVPLRDGTLTAVQLSNGAVVWSIEQPTRVPPVVGGGIVVIASGSQLIGRHVDDARHLWTTDIGSTVSAPLLWTAGWLVAVLENGEVITLRGVDGFEFWRVNVSGELTTRPSVAGKELFVPVRDGRIIALDLLTGERVWESMLAGSPQEVLPLDDLFVGATDNFFYRLSRTDGRMHWRWRTGGDIVGPPAVDERHVVFVSLDNMVRALDRDSGALRWRRPLTGRPTGGPQAVAEMVFVSGVSPELRAFDMTSGRSAGVMRSPGEFAAPPHLIRAPAPLAPAVIVTTGDGRLVGLLQATGPQRVSLDFPPPPLLPGPAAVEPAHVLPVVPLDPLDARPTATNPAAPAAPTSADTVNPSDLTPPP